MSTSLASSRPRLLASGVTFLKTLVSDYQILSPVQSFTCTLVQQSSQYKTMTLPGRFVMRFLPYSSLSTADVDLFSFFSWCCKLDAPLSRAITD
jgi:hypothetical protein